MLRIKRLRLEILYFSLDFSFKKTNSFILKSARVLLPETLPVDQSDVEKYKLKASQPACLRPWCSPHAYTEKFIADLEAARQSQAYYLASFLALVGLRPPN